LNALSRLDIDSLNIHNQETEEALAFLSGSKNISTSNTELTIPMNIELIFKKQAKIKEPELREK
jgi:hypothetical protein